MNQMDFFKSATLGILLLVASAVAREVSRAPIGDVPSQYALDLEHLPQNTAVYDGTDVVLTCWVTAVGNTRLQWIEYAYNPNGNLISDGDLILPANPNHAKYNLTRTDPRQYDLTIRGATFADAGTYSCFDSVAGTTEKNRHSAELTVIAGLQNCTTTIPAGGAVIEGDYYSTECTLDYEGNISPDGEWTGPEPFGQGQSDNGWRVWSGMSFYAHRTMNSNYWRNTYSFTDYFLPVPGDSASNIPSFEQSEDSPRVTVYWRPQNMSIQPIKTEYQVGDVLECFADSFPAASYRWQNMRLNEFYPGSLLILPPEWEGTEQTLRCEAETTITGTAYSNDIYLSGVNIPGPTTTPTTTTPTTTTLPPPVSDCLNLAGRWESEGPTPAYMCLEVIGENGNLHGVLRNDTETFWIDLVGVTDLNTYDHASFTGIWPLNRAVSTFIGECSRCHGKEHLLINAVSRSKGGPPCATPGEINYSLQYDFLRNPSISCPPITIPPSFLDDEE